MIAENKTKIVSYMLYDLLNNINCMYGILLLLMHVCILVYHYYAISELQ